MRHEFVFASALLIDLLIGDPRWLPHPVRGIGFLASLIESATRYVFHFSLRFAGIIAALLVISICGLFSWTIIHFLSKASPIAGKIAGIYFIFASIASRDLFNHSNSVLKALKIGSIDKARQKVSMIVGRDTAHLDNSEIVRASVETVAESLVDGVTAPLFFAFLFGPTGAFVYRAINTLDSMFGHKNDKYIYFGWASARIDDIANYVPSRITAPLIAAGAFLTKLSFTNSLRILFRDGRKHHSPNSGLSEAAFAGALNVQLGGLNYYNGIPDQKPLIGDKSRELVIDDIRRANILMILTAILFTFAGTMTHFLL